DLRFFRFFRADLSIRKSSSFLPRLIAATSQVGLAPRPAQVSPEWLRYRRDFPSLQCASTASHNPSSATKHLQLLFNFGPTLIKGLVNPLSQVHECFNGHP